MQAVKLLGKTLAEFASADRYLFTPSDLKAILPNHTEGAFRAVLFRAEREGSLRHVCRGIYLFERVAYPRGMVLYHTAARLRANSLSYISLETALSDLGVISQLLIDRITVMSSGRSSLVDCGIFGSIEFVHTKKTAEQVADRLVYDSRCRLWRATAALALEDLKATRRNLDLVDQDALHELV